jgi:hypothetical protein
VRENESAESITSEPRGQASNRVRLARRVWFSPAKTGYSLSQIPFSAQQAGLPLGPLANAVTAAHSIVVHAQGDSITWPLEFDADRSIAIWIRMFESTKELYRQCRPAEARLARLAGAASTQ